jgi:hypothetical protein
LYSRQITHRIFSRHSKKREQVLVTRIELSPAVSDGKKKNAEQVLATRLELSPAVSYGKKKMQNKFS